MASLWKKQKQKQSVSSLPQNENCQWAELENQISPIHEQIIQNG